MRLLLLLFLLIALLACVPFLFFSLRVRLAAALRRASRRGLLLGLLPHFALQRTVAALKGRSGSLRSGSRRRRGWFPSGLRTRRRNGSIQSGLWPRRHGLLPTGLRTRRRDGSIPDGLRPRCRDRSIQSGLWP